MDEKLELAAADKYIEFSVNAENWCNVIFHHADMDELGADKKDIVIQRFRLILEGDKFPETTHQLEGKNYSCFIMLSEKHASGYTRRTKKGLVLHFRNSEGQKIGEMTLTKSDCARWKKLLDDFR